MFIEQSNSNMFYLSNRTFFKLEIFFKFATLQYLHNSFPLSISIHKIEWQKMILKRLSQYITEVLNTRCLRWDKSCFYRAISTRYCQYPERYNSHIIVFRALPALFDSYHRFSNPETGASISRTLNARLGESATLKIIRGSLG